MCHLRVSWILVRSSTRFLNRHLIGPQLTYFHPARRYYHDYESYAFRSRYTTTTSDRCLLNCFECSNCVLVGLFSRSRRQLAATLNKECQFGFSAEAVEEPADLDAAIAYYQLDEAGDTVFSPLQVRTKTLVGQTMVTCSWTIPV